DKKVVIHAAVVSKAETAGEMKGPALGQTPPAPPPAARGGAGGAGRAGRGRGGTPPPIPPPPPAAEIKAAGAAVEQTVQGKKPEIPLGVHFDGLGEGFTQRVLPGVESTTVLAGRGGIDISLAVGPNHVFEVLGGASAIFDKNGKLLYGPVPNNTIFTGFGNRCAVTNNSDTVVRYDQLADRWLFVLPVFSSPYAMCYAVSATSDPRGPYYRYEFQRPLFPDYPRPAIWPDGYYNPTSTSDNYLPEVVTQKHECIADRNKMLQGLPATEQC